MGPMGGTSQDADNAIYTSVFTLKSLGLDADTTANDDDHNTTTQLGYTYVLGSADDYETFASDVRKAGLDDTYTVQSADVENHESSLVPLDNLAEFALTLSSSYWRSVRSCSIYSTSANANTRSAYSPPSA